MRPYTRFDYNSGYKLLNANPSKKWAMPIRNWKGILNRFIIEFEDRLTEYV